MVSNPSVTNNKSFLASIIFLTSGPFQRTVSIWSPLGPPFLIWRYPSCSEYLLYPYLIEINLKIEAKHDSVPEPYCFFYTDTIVFNPYLVVESCTRMISSSPKILGKILRTNLVRDCYLALIQALGSK
jgi:hypothetical protein